MQIKKLKVPRLLSSILLGALLFGAVQSAKSISRAYSFFKKTQGASLLAIGSPGRGGDTGGWGC